MKWPTISESIHFVITEVFSTTNMFCVIQAPHLVDCSMINISQIKLVCNYESSEFRRHWTRCWVSFVSFCSSLSTDMFLRSFLKICAKYFFWIDKESCSPALVELWVLEAYACVFVESFLFRSFLGSYMTTVSFSVTECKRCQALTAGCDAVTCGTNLPICEST
jgi:hypothetical protein